MKIYTQKEWEKQMSLNKKEVDKSSFDSACGHFRQICHEIGELIGNNDFKGGYDDMLVFYASDAYKTDKGLQLATAWAGVNELCKYEAYKLGMGSPAWWHKCWSTDNIIN